MRLIDADAKILVQFYDEEHEEWEVRKMRVEDYLSYSDTPIPFVDAVPVAELIKMEEERNYWEEMAHSFERTINKLARTGE